MNISIRVAGLFDSFSEPLYVIIKGDGVNEMENAEMKTFLDLCRAALSA